MLRIAGLTVATLILCAGTASAAGTGRPSYQDWSGVWLNITGIYFSNPGTFRPLQNAGSATNPPPLNAEYQKKWEATLAASARGEPTEDRGAKCLPGGTPSGNLSPMPQEFLIMPDKVVILSEAGGRFREIYLDGSKYSEDVDPTFNGFATGRWEGDTLVVDTVGLRPDFPLDQSGVQHTDQLTVRERFRKIAPDLIENEITMTDPGAFTKPWKAKVQFRRMPPGPANRLLEWVCTDNNRNGVGADGSTYTLGPDGKPLTGPTQ